MPASPPLTADLLASGVRRIAGDRFSCDTPLALAVSGGADSLALLALAATAFGRRAHVLTVDHGLRAGSAGECAQVMATAHAVGLPASTLTLSLASGANLHDRARTARYAAMAAACKHRGIGYLLTAHHLEDQAETLLLRLARGSGLPGLSGIRAASSICGITVLRPLLGHRRAQLQDIVRKAGWAAADDPSNSDPRFDRTRARALLASTDWLDPARLAASASHLADADVALGWIEDRLWDSRAAPDGDGLWLDPEGLPSYLQRRLLERACAELGAPKPDGPALTRLLARLDAGSGGTLGGFRIWVSPPGWRAAPVRPHGGAALPRP